jgi:thermopsin
VTYIPHVYPSRPMTRAKWLGWVVMVGVALLMLGTGITSAGTAAAAPLNPLLAGSAPLVPVAPIGHAAQAPTAPGILSAHVASEIAKAGIPKSEVFLPNFESRVAVSNHLVTPLYNATPAPMGIGDFGVQDMNGTNVGTVTYTPSVEGVLQLSELNDTYLDAAGPNEVSIQLNTVATGVDLFGNASYQFWVQNVPVWIPNIDQLSIVENLWNFSSPAFNFTANSIYSGDGTIIAPVLYIANGPTWHPNGPFTIRVYNNASLVNNRPALYLNYSLSFANGTTIAGSYDCVVFNSTSAPSQTTPAPVPTFQIDGQQYGGQGYLINDAELMIGGSGGGDTTLVSDIAGSMQLLIQPNGTTSYQSVPAAYDFGTDTGETSTGIAEWASSPGIPTIHLGPGPSFLGPMWGLVGAQWGHVTQSLDVQPSNAFVFASVGHAFLHGNASWAPVPISGQATYELPPGSYSYWVLLSEYHPTSFTVNGNGAHNVSLAWDPCLGVYTPLWAWSNVQLAAISQWGDGTFWSPYVLFNHPGVIDPIFGQFNDYLFPSFPGILLAFTTDYVRIVQPPTFLITYDLPGMAQALGSFGLPDWNYLEYQFENASHVSVLGAQKISGWVFAEDTGFALASMVLWNSSYDLIAGNYFETQSLSLYIAGGTGNVVWGNNFSFQRPLWANPGNLGFYSDEVGIEMFASGNLVYNNYFNDPIPAVTPTYDPSTFQPASYTDTWNVSRAPWWCVNWVNGVPLWGNILGGWFQGGNYWSNYGGPSNPHGSLPYNDSGLITNGGDYLPLVPHHHPWWWQPTQTAPAARRP